MIPVFVAADERYSPFVATTFMSIMENTSEKVVFYVIDCGISIHSKKKIIKSCKHFTNAQIKFINLDVLSNFENFRVMGYLSLAMYARLLIADLVPDIKKAIYTDVDVIFCSDIAEIYNTDLQNCVIGACWEDFQEENKVNQERKQRLGIDQNHHYFSSGLLLMDLEKWRQKEITRKVFEIEKQLRDVLSCPDQDILNKLFENNYVNLHPSYCVVNQRLKSFSKNGQLLNVRIRHYNGPKKPWMFPPETRESGGLIGLKLFWRYAKKSPFYWQMLSSFGAKYLLKKALKKIKRFIPQRN